MAQPPVAIIHPSRAFSEALGNVLNNACFDPVYFATHVDCMPVDAVSKPVLFIVGGRVPRHTANLIHEIRKRPDLAIIVAIGDTNEPEPVTMAVEAGATGYLREAMTSKMLIMALKLALHEETVLAPVAARCLPAHLASPREVMHCSWWRVAVLRG